MNPRRNENRFRLMRTFAIIIVIFIFLGITNKIFNITYYISFVIICTISVYAIIDSERERKKREKEELSEELNVHYDKMNRMITYIKEIRKGNIEENLESRINEENLDGIYKTAVDEFNRLLDKIADLVKDNELYRLLFDTAPAVLTVWDKDLNILETNEEAVRRYGLKDKEDYKKRINETYTKYQANGMLSSEYAKIVVSEGFRKERHSFEWTHLDRNGELIPSEIIGFTYTYRGEKVFITYAIDLREAKKFEERLRESEEIQKAAIETSLAKTRFLAKMSHEIRTPISAVLGISEIELQKTDHELPVYEAFEKIHASSNVLLSIVNDILDMSKIESGKMDVINAKYDVYTFIEDTISLNLAFLGSKPLEFKVSVDPKMPAVLEGDELRVRQIINNILSNAFKYTTEGSVILDIKAGTHLSQGYCNMIITITDTGIGMTQEQVTAIFEEYIRFHEKENRFIQGTGLGMPLTNSFVQLLGGTIEIESEVGLGTIVTVVLPHHIVTSEALGFEHAHALETFKKSGYRVTNKPEMQAVSMSYGSVLVVDDVEANLYVANGLLSLFNIQVETLKSGQEAIALVQSGKVYDIIFMDQMMPGMNGLEATQAIRALGYTAPIVAFTANALVGQAEEYIENGFDGFISKPIQFADLNALLHKFIKDKYDAIGLPDVHEEEGLDYLDDPVFKREIQRDFLETHSNLYNEILLSLEAADLDTASLKCHTLKGLAGLLNEQKVKHLAQQLESDLKNGVTSDAHTLARLGRQFDKMLERVINDLDLRNMR